MSFLDDSICKCCVCPMQCVLDQLKGEIVTISTTTGDELDLTIIDAKDFILSTFDSNFQINRYF
ncbi:hypothetical protein VQL36_18195 [Chengkuizengella sp. SCS-71B]|uniref:hypothetical protein n=1 Tax=Chengkuizengella sp. SCS-71B TaxID=3115290 RepID=UPI0032C21F08